MLEIILNQTDDCTFKLLLQLYSTDKPKGTTREAQTYIKPTAKRHKQKLNLLNLRIRGTAY